MSENKKPVIRFAPSPTGYLHIGGARTALFNWLYARHTGGTFLLRIEDTDRERSTPEAVNAILHGLEWMGLNWDGQTVYQFARAPRHRAVAEQLLAEGKAYRCFATPEELNEMREAQRAAGKPIRYDGRWRDRDPAEGGDKPYVIRLKARQTGETIVKDVVLGDVVFQNDQLDDMILLRSDGTPTYMLAVVVDDADMGVTHVIRGADHLNNAARQLQIIEQMGWPVPTYAHVPLIHGPDGAKLSKRHGALAVEAYRDMGYLPETMRNYLLRLGWSHGDDEIISTQQAIEWFNLESIGKSPARMDFKKLDNLNGHYIRETDNTALTAEIVALLARRTPPHPLSMLARERLTALMPGLKERAKTLVELANAADFLYTDGPRTLDAAAEKLLTDGRAVLAKVLPALEATDWSGPALEEAARAFAAAEGLKLGQVAQPLRAAVTGKSSSPPLF
ncbi:MAG: glutamate--tRNA ligase, partial [Alphaproteobacteria bacterium]|nr:glutamate--tRNA ligase [Alphaproteobacteria bacterium]